MPRGELYLGFNQVDINDFNRRVEEARALLDVASGEVVMQEPQSEVVSQSAESESTPRVSA